MLMTMPMIPKTAISYTPLSLFYLDSTPDDVHAILEGSQVDVPSAIMLSVLALL